MGDADTVEGVGAMANEEDAGREVLGRLGATLAHAVVALLWYLVIRFVVVAAFSLPWTLLKGPAAAGVWLLIVQPFAVGVAAFLTLQTNVRNLPLHRVMMGVILVTAVVGQLHLATANTFVAQASDGARIAGFVAQAVMVVAFTWLSMKVVARRRARLSIEE
jgi:hypothetical protein